MSMTPWSQSPVHYKSEILVYANRLYFQHLGSKGKLEYMRPCLKGKKRKEGGREGRKEGGRGIIDQEKPGLWATVSSNLPSAGTYS